MSFHLRTLDLFEENVALYSLLLYCMFVLCRGLSLQFKHVMKIYCNNADNDDDDDDDENDNDNDNNNN